MHVYFPENDPEMFKKIKKDKELLIEEKLSKSDFDFEGAILPSLYLRYGKEEQYEWWGQYYEWFEAIRKSVGNINLNHVKIFGDLIIDSLNITQISLDCASVKGSITINCMNVSATFSFSDIICSSIQIDDSKFAGNIFLDGIRSSTCIFNNNTINNNFRLKNSNSDYIKFFNNILKGSIIELSQNKIQGDLTFFKTKCEHELSLTDASVQNNLSFNECEVQGNTDLNGSIIGNNAIFIKTKFYQRLSLDCIKIGNNLDLRETIITGPFFLDTAKIDGQIFYDENNFYSYHGKESIYRRSKKIAESVGDKFQADEFYFKEMHAKRKQKSIVNQIIELPLEYVFSYGVKPLRLFGVWIIIILIFASLFWILRAIESTSAGTYIYFSVVTAMTPGYGGITPKTGLPQYIASIEAIIGTFLWACFIAFFIRKFVR